MREPTEKEMVDGIANGFKQYLDEQRLSDWRDMSGYHLELITEKAIKQAVIESIKNGSFLPKT